MRELLGLSIAKKKDNLLNDIKMLFEGKVMSHDQKSFDNYKQEIEGMESFLAERILNKLIGEAHWEFIAYPEEYIDRIENPKQIKQMIDSAMVELRGWPYPYFEISSSNTANIENGITYYCDSNIRLEGLGAFKSGLYIWKSSLFEDRRLKNYKNGGLWWESALLLITEFIMFLKKYYRDICSNQNVILNVNLLSVLNRQLTTTQSGGIIRNSEICKLPDVKTSKAINENDLRSDFKEVARYFAKEIFYSFNWDVENESLLEQWQDRLINRNL